MHLWNFLYWLLNSFLFHVQWETNTWTYVDLQNHCLCSTAVYRDYSRRPPSWHLSTEFCANLLSHTCSEFVSACGKKYTQLHTRLLLTNGSPLNTLHHFSLTFPYLAIYNIISHHRNECSQKLPWASKINYSIFVQDTNKKTNQTWSKTKNRHSFFSRVEKEPEMLLLNSS